MYNTAGGKNFFIIFSSFLSFLVLRTSFLLLTAANHYLILVLHIPSGIVMFSWLPYTVLPVTRFLIEEGCLPIPQQKPLGDTLVAQII